MRLISASFLAMIIFYATPSSSQVINDCGRTDKTVAQIVQGCKDIMSNKSKTDREVASAARRLGLLLQIDKKELASTIIGYFLISAQKGELASFAEIGDLYRNGYKDLKPDFEKAIYYYRQDTSISTTRLKGEGEMLLSGQGLEQSTEGAIRAFILAAHFNDEDSWVRKQLCDIYSDDKYARKDLVMAHFWCSNAVDVESSAMMKGFFENFKINLEVQLSTPQLAASNRIKQECKKSSLLTCLKR